MSTRPRCHSSGKNIEEPNVNRNKTLVNVMNSYHIMYPSIFRFPRQNGTALKSNRSLHIGNHTTGRYTFWRRNTSPWRNIQGNWFWHGSTRFAAWSAFLEYFWHSCGQCRTNHHRNFVCEGSMFYFFPGLMVFGTFCAVHINPTVCIIFVILGESNFKDMLSMWRETLEIVLLKLSLQTAAPILNSLKTRETISARG